MSQIIVDEKIIDEILTRSVQEILPSKEELKKVMMSGKKLKIYIGTDATGTSLHLGHSTNYIILEKFRKLGHEIIFLIGDFTSRIGDPTDKTSARVQLTREQVVENVKTWLTQVRPIINFEDTINPVKIVYNHDWLSKLTFEDIIDIASNFTVQRMLERDMFEKRINENKPIYLHEFLYPLMQGWDSVHLDVDIEICGNDQKFNALAGRTLQKKYHDKEKFVFITTLLVNPITGEKMMSKSLGTGVFLDETHINMYGKIMAQADENISQLFIDCSYYEIDKIKQIQSKLHDNQINPRDIKMELAYEITKIYHGEEKAIDAQKYFIKTVQHKEIPDDMPEYAITQDKNILDVLLETKLISSKGEGRRLLSENGIKINSSVITDEKNIIKKGEEIILQRGKRQFVRVK